MVIDRADGARLHVTTSGDADADHTVLQIAGGPGCRGYLPTVAVDSPVQLVSFDPRGVGRSTGGPHGTAQAIEDLEAVRRGLAVKRWYVAGHSWGADLAVLYALDYPEAVRGVLSACAHGFHDDRGWHAAYQARRDQEAVPELEYDESVHEVLADDFKQVVHAPELLARLAALDVPVHVLAAELDIRPDWPLRQLAALLPCGGFEVLPGVGQHFWYDRPDLWRRLVVSLAG